MLVSKEFSEVTMKYLQLGFRKGAAPGTTLHEGHLLLYMGKDEEDIDKFILSTGAYQATNYLKLIYGNIKGKYNQEFKLLTFSCCVGKACK